MEHVPALATPLHVVILLVMIAKLPMVTVSVD
jgi:hypothetical protein